MRDRSIHSGTLLDIEQTQFSVNEPNVAQPVRIAYEDVEKVKAARPADTASVRRVLKPVAVGGVVCAVILEGNRQTAYAYVSEESHGGIVPMNHLNKGKIPSAESEEGRPPVKENAGQPNTYPTHSGKGVSPGLAGVRKAAKENKEMKFTALLHHLTATFRVSTDEVMVSVSCKKSDVVACFVAEAHVCDIVWLRDSLYNPIW